MTEATQIFARQIRAHAVKMVTEAKSSHIGGAFSMADLLAVLYGEILRVRPDDPDWPERDRFILSKGHCCVSLYAALALRGFFPVEEMRTFGQDDSRLMAHIDSGVPGVDYSTGSLGHGLPVGCGWALAAKRRGYNWRTFVLVSDGELDEGSTWEAILFAPHHLLDNLTLIIDHNKIQSLGRVQEVLNLGSLKDKFAAFGWAVKEIDGHDCGAIRDVLLPVPWEKGKPSCIIAHTVKGKGVDFMENQILWHYRTPDAEQLTEALRQIGAPS